jgi:adenosylmethionine-8-amino-7-oxononanoate aminotransferase
VALVASLSRLQDNRLSLAMMEAIRPKLKKARLPSAFRMKRSRRRFAPRHADRTSTKLEDAVALSLTHAVIASISEAIQGSPGALVSP